MCAPDSLDSGRAITDLSVACSESRHPDSGASQVRAIPADYSGGTQSPMRSSLSGCARVCVFGRCASSGDAAGPMDGRSHSHSARPALRRSARVALVRGAACAADDAGHERPARARRGRRELRPHAAGGGLRYAHRGRLRSGLAYLELAAPSVVILDLHLPDGTGLDCLRRVRSWPRHGELPVAILTGDYFLDEEIARELNALGARVFFKPVGRTTFCASSAS